MRTSKFKICVLGLIFYGLTGIYAMALALTSETQATLVADNFLKFLGSSKTIVVSHALNHNRLDSSKPAVLAGWVMDLSGGGYILISSSQAFSPIKAYSLTRQYAALPFAYRQFIEKEMELHARLEIDTVSGRRTTQAMSISKAASKAWDFLLNMDATGRTIQSYTPGTSLLTTTWNQGYPYNKFLPQIDGQAVVAGCVNIAAAQVMKYHQYPDQGRGSTSYLWNGQTLSTILYHPYYWQNIPDAPGMATADYLQDETAILIRDLSIVNQTSFGLDNSSAYFHTDAFTRFFGYSNTISQMANDNVDTFFTTLKSQIDAQLPVLLSLPGHMVVVDGYSADATGRNFHLNMGWGGVDNNFYYLDVYNVTEIAKWAFAPDLDMIYNIKPCTGPDCVDPEPVIQDVPPVFNTQFKDVIMSKDQIDGVKLRIDARDENGDDVTLDVVLSNPDTISASLDKNILTIIPLAGSNNTAAAIRLTAKANGTSVTKEFKVLVSDQALTYGTQQTVSGRFESQDGVYSHQVILGGPCTISGDRGYSNQAFYMGAGASQNGVPPAISSTAITQTFDFGVYIISASLTSGNTSYSYKPGSYDEYVIRINAPQATADIEQIAGVLGIDLSKTSFSVPGDITSDGQITLADKILALKILTHLSDAPAYDPTDDLNADGKIGIEEAMFWPDL
ncbi:MAG: C10 family peptidase [Pseudomonadota bacterium]